MSLAHPLSLRARLVLGSAALLLAAGITARLVAGGPGADADDAPPPPPEATLTQGPDGRPALQLAQGQAEALGLQTVPAQATTASDPVPLHGAVLDPLPFLELEARQRAAGAALRAARATEEAARAELERVQALHAADRGASDRALQEAQGAAASAAAQRSSAEGEARRAEAAWSQTGLRDTAGLADFRRVLVRLELPLGVPAPSPLPRILAATAPGVPGALRLEIVGLAPGGSPVTGGLAILALAPGRALRPGLPVDAGLAGRPAPRTVVPRAALLWSDGKAQVFVAVGPGRFQPRGVEVAFPLAQGVALASGLEKGEAVVVQGALALQGEYARLAEGTAIGAGGV